MFRLLQVINFLMIVPIMCLGMMSSLSGGGMTPAFQQIGRYMLLTPVPTALASIIIAEILWRLEQPILAYIALAVPFVIWVGLLVWLQIETGFFF